MKKFDLDLWIARDKDGTLFLYHKKPEKYDNCYNEVPNGWTESMDDDLVPDLKFEDGPVHLEIANSGDYIDDSYWTVTKTSDYGIC